MKRKLIALFFAAVCLIGLVSCNEKKTETATGEETYVRYDYDLSRYIYIPQYRNLAITCQDPEVCTDKEIDDALTQVLLSYATFEEKEEQVVERFNRVKFDYQMYLNGKELEDYHEENYIVVVGSEGYGDLDYTIGMALIGAKRGEERETEYTFPENDPEVGTWAGQTVILKAKVKTVEQHFLPECNDDFVASLEGEGGTFATVAEFREALRESILYKKETAMVNAVFETYMTSVKVLEYPEREVQYYVDLEWESVVQTAALLSMSEDDYLGAYLGVDRALWEAQTRISAKEWSRTIWPASSCPAFWGR
ncbi:MAG: hypothetical protein IKC69_02200, partial [Clostridia bacterium]|nr:hypothetical protein [Clostridia bacterium]